MFDKTRKEGEDNGNHTNAMTAGDISLTRLPRAKTKWNFLAPGKLWLNLAWLLTDTVERLYDRDQYAVGLDYGPWAL